MIYLDNNATTRLDPAISALINPLMSELIGNPSSIHQLGQKAKALLTDSTKTCARFFGVRPDEVIYTSGATEALNALIQTLPKGSHVVTSSLEHAAVLEPLKKCGAIVSYLDLERGKGEVTVSQVQKAVQDKTAMIILAAANNETGIKAEIEKIASFASQAAIPFVVDGVALLGKGLFTLHEGISAVCFSGHKIHAPLGVGVSIVRRSLKMPPLIVGGTQQRGLRAGTENLPAIVGFAKALELLERQGAQWILQMTSLRDRLEKGLCTLLPDIVIHGKNDPRVSNTSNIAFPGVDGETLIMALDLAGVAASHGSACSSGTLETSRVLLNMGIKPQIARSSIRFSLSRFTTPEEIDICIPLIVKVIKQIQHINQGKNYEKIA